VACPICFCKECVFRTETFEPESERYFQGMQRKGALRLPSETLLYQLTRLNHMVASYVGCGMCESACPSNLPLTVIFRSVGAGVQKMLNCDSRQVANGRRIKPRCTSHKLNLWYNIGAFSASGFDTNIFL
jgi:ferredoxin